MKPGVKIGLHHRHMAGVNLVALRIHGESPRLRTAPATEHRMVNAAEYAAYQLGQINRNLARLVEILAKRET